MNVVDALVVYAMYNGEHYQTTEEKKALQDAIAVLTERAHSVAQEYRTPEEDIG